MSTIWTDQKPTNPGWYWWKCTDKFFNHHPCVVQIIGDPPEQPRYWIVRGVGINWSLGNTPGQWSSEPIAEPGEPT